MALAGCGSDGDGSAGTPVEPAAAASTEAPPTTEAVPDVTADAVVGLLAHLDGAIAAEVSAAAEACAGWLPGTFVEEPTLPPDVVGYGVVTAVGRDPYGSGADPSLLPGEDETGPADEALAGLLGPDPGPDDPPADGEPADLYGEGCLGDALRDLVPGLTALTELGETLDALIADLRTTPGEVADRWAAWSTCMAEAGSPGTRDELIDGLRAELAALAGPAIEELERGEGDPPADLTDGSDEPVELVQLDPEAMGALEQRELAAWALDQGCSAEHLGADLDDVELTAAVRVLVRDHQDLLQQVPFEELQR